MTVATETRIERPHRWGTPFGRLPLDDDDLRAVLEHPRFAAIDAGRFPASASLEDLLRNDGRILRFDRGDVVVRVGDYGGSMFAVLSGRVRVLVDERGEKILGGRAEAPELGILSALAERWSPRRMPEVRDLDAYATGRSLSVREEGESARAFVRDPDALIERFQTIPMEAGDLFGEIGPLARSPRTATVFVDSDDAVLLELRWQGLRDILRRDRAFRAHVEGLYRDRSLRRQLAVAPLFAHLPDDVLGEIARETLFESHGDEDWFAEFAEVADRDSAEVIALEPIVAEEGNHLGGLFLVTAGFARVSRRRDQGHRTLGYLRAGEVFGLEELYASWTSGEDPVLRRSLRAVGTLSCARVPTWVLEKHVFPKLPPDQVPSPSTLEEEEDLVRSDQALFDALVDRRIINGTATMVLDADRCVACDLCVSACAATHQGNPRFVRHGHRHRNLQFTNACMHCVDPVCLIGCPTGAIHRRRSDGLITIDDVTCIGCGACADACPYDNIRMVPIRDPAGSFVVDEETNAPILKATKCDLCAGQPAAPACENACPTDALLRVDMKDRDRLVSWSRGTHRPRARMRSAVAAAAGLAVLASVHGFFEGAVARPHHLSGWVLALTVILLAAYAIRRRLLTWAPGPTSTWARVHSWLGAFGVGAFLVHTGGSLPRGGADVALWIVFVVVAGLGIFGAFVQKTFPGRLRRRGEPVLFDRIDPFRRQLAREVAELVERSIDVSASSTVADLYRSRLHEFFARRRNFVHHVFESRGPIHQILAEISSIERYLGEEDQEILSEIRERVWTKDGLDYQSSLQSVLRGWRPLHLALTGALLILGAVHGIVMLGLGGGP